MIDPVAFKINFQNRINEIVAALNVIEAERHLAAGYSHKPDLVTSKVRSKFVAIDFGYSGAFLVEKSTGELYNIKSKYGVPDYNKKQKANLGNIFTVDPRQLHSRRWNYLR